MTARIGEALRRAYLEACRIELRALKPGNVHIHGAPGAAHGMTVADFEASALASAPALADPALAIGARMREAVAATRAAVGTNTNLGIVLLAAPLVAAAQRAASEDAGAAGLRPALRAVLAALDRADAAAAYAAIRLAQPAGMGRVAAEDVAEEPGVTLGEAMGLAASRDLIARQYVTGYAAVFELGVARLEAAGRAGATAEWAASLAFMDFLAAFPDSHIARKHGAAIAEAVRERAAALAPLLLPEEEARHRGELRELDHHLKERGWNPGTSADLTVASLLAQGCTAILAAKSRRGLTRKTDHTRSLA